MTTVLDPLLPACAESPDLFLDERLQGDVDSPADAAEANRIRADLHRACAACPLMTDCLYRAVVEVDVSGFVACTTEVERATIRRNLGVDVSPAPLLTFGAPRIGGGPVSHEAVLTMRQAHPKDTCQQLAERLGCSMSTVKRHLRRERDHQAAEIGAPQRRPAPTMEQVLDAFDALDSAQVA